MVTSSDRYATFVDSIFSNASNVICFSKSYLQFKNEWVENWTYLELNLILVAVFWLYVTPIRSPIIRRKQKDKTVLHKGNGLHEMHM